MLVSSHLQPQMTSGTMADAGNPVDVPGHPLGRAGHVPVRLQRRRHQLSLSLRQGMVYEQTKCHFDGEFGRLNGSNMCFGHIFRLKMLFWPIH